MIFEETNPYEVTTYYEILDITPSATPSEVRAAYLRAKSAYNKDSVALYSLIDPNERETMLRRIEEAYETLSNDLKRREYDANHGIIENTGVIDAAAPPIAKVVSIDRVPPMETMSTEEDLLVAPSTDFSTTEATPNPAPPSIAMPGVKRSEPPLRSEPVPQYSSQFTPQSLPQPSSQPANDIGAANANSAAEIEREILDETQWHGSFLRRVRDAQSVSLEEMSNVTKISKTYIQAIEQEDFKKLPALVFVRGFVNQICRVLRLPTDKVLDAYLQRFKAAKGIE